MIRQPKSETAGWECVSLWRDMNAPNKEAIVGLQKNTEVVLQRAEAEEKRIQAKEISNEL